MLPWTPWVDSSPSKGDWVLPESPNHRPLPGADSTTQQVQLSTTGHDSAPTASDGPQERMGQGSSGPSARGSSPGAGSGSGGTKAGPSSDDSANSGVETALSAGMSVRGLVKRWGNTNDPLYGDVHFYNYMDDCQVGWRQL